MANLLVQAGVSRVLAVDLHSAQIQGYFDIPCDHIYGASVLVDYLDTRQLKDYVVVSPDVGGVARARAFAKRFNDAPLAIIDKRRASHNVAESLTVIGEVADRTAILVDDMIDTGGTIHQGARLLKAQGARTVIACVTHPVFSPPALERLQEPGTLRGSGGHQQHPDPSGAALPPTDGALHCQRDGGGHLAHPRGELRQLHVSLRTLGWALR